MQNNSLNNSQIPNPPMLQSAPGDQQALSNKPPVQPRSSNRRLIIWLVIGGILMAALIILILILQDDRVICSETNYDGDTVTEIAHFRDGYLERTDDEKTYIDAEDAMEECEDAKDIYEGLSDMYRVSCNGNSVLVEELISTPTFFASTKEEYISKMQKRGYICK